MKIQRQSQLCFLRARCAQIHVLHPCLRNIYHSAEHSWCSRCPCGLRGARPGHPLPPDLASGPAKCPLILRRKSRLLKDFFSNSAGQLPTQPSEAPRPVHTRHTRARNHSYMVTQLPNTFPHPHTDTHLLTDKCTGGLSQFELFLLKLLSHVLSCPTLSFWKLPTHLLHASILLAPRHSCPSW